nr:hypothetical protein [Tanacetum cinerariifolium]
TGYRGTRLPTDVDAAHHSLTTSGVARFNKLFPQGLPNTWGGQGDELVNGVRYYSWSGTLQPGSTDRGKNLFDTTNLTCRIFARTFKKERGQSDGWSGDSVRIWAQSSVTTFRSTILTSSTSTSVWWARGPILWGCFLSTPAA